MAKAGAPLKRTLPTRLLAHILCACVLLPQDVLQSEGYNACLQLLKKVHDQQKEPELTKILSETLKMRLPENKQLAIGTTLAEVPAKTSDRASEERIQHSTRKKVLRSWPKPSLYPRSAPY